MAKQVYGPDNGWYYRLDDNDNVERAYPSAGRKWEKVAADSAAALAILNAVAGAGRSGSMTESSNSVVRKLLKSSGDTISPFTPSPYTPPSSPTYLPPQTLKKRGKGGKGGKGGGGSDTWKLVGIGTGGLLLVGGLLYAINQMQEA